MNDAIKNDEEKSEGTKGGKNSDDLHPVWQKFQVNDKNDHVQIKGTSIIVIEYQLE